MEAAKDAIDAAAEALEDSRNDSDKKVYLIEICLLNGATTGITVEAVNRAEAFSVAIAESEVGEIVKAAVLVEEDGREVDMRMGMKAADLYKELGLKYGKEDKE